ERAGARGVVRIAAVDGGDVVGARRRERGREGPLPGGRDVGAAAEDGPVVLEDDVPRRGGPRGGGRGDRGGEGHVLVEGRRRLRRGDARRGAVTARQRVDG